MLIKFMTILEYFTATWHALWPLRTFLFSFGNVCVFSVLVFCIKKNLATLVLSEER
jgi:hypothetical protein